MTSALLLAALAVTIYMKADILMLGLLAGGDETGIYTAAARLSEVWYFIPTAAAAALRPRLARMFAADQPARYQAATQRFMTALNAIALVTIMGVLLASDRIIGLLHGRLNAGSDFLPPARSYGSTFSRRRSCSSASLVASGSGTVV